MGKKLEKTNVMRILDQKKINYHVHTYDSQLLNAVEVANYLKQSSLILFKTLVTIGKSKQYYVFMIPGEKELDLKKAAKVAGEKSLEMLPQKELLPLTGYIHGGCSPIGMKKQFKTFIHETAKDNECIYFSAGKIGFQIETSLLELQKVIPVIVADIIKSS